MKNILIVEDEPHVIRVFKMALERKGHTVETAPDGIAALEWLETGHPDVLITDIHMPKMAGQELCETIVKKFPGRQFLIFVITSRTEIEHREWTRNIHNLLFLEKPVSIRKLLSMIDSYFENLENT